MGRHAHPARVGSEGGRRIRGCPRQEAWEENLGRRGQADLRQKFSLMRLRAAAAVRRCAVRIGCIRLRRSGRADDPRIFLPVSWRLSAHASDPAVAHSLIGHWCSAARGRRVLLLATGRFWATTGQVLAGRHAHGCQPGCQQGCKTEKPQRFHYIAPVRINCEPGTREGCRRCATLTPFGWPQRRAADSAHLGAQEPDRLHRVSAVARGIEPFARASSIALVGAAPVERWKTIGAVSLPLDPSARRLIGRCRPPPLG